VIDMGDDAKVTNLRRVRCGRLRRLTYLDCRHDCGPLLGVT